MSDHHLNHIILSEALQDLPIGPLRFLEQTGSTNDESARWAESGAPDLALVVADEQTAGRGRLSRRWFTPPGAALAFSLVLYPPEQEDWLLPRYTALGALAVCTALQQSYNLPAQIKWPNDILVAGQKLAGVLAEACWQGEALAYLILGIGINVFPHAIPPASALRFPATCLLDCLSQAGYQHITIHREILLRQVLEQLLTWKTHLNEPRFLHAWESNLAFRDQEVIITTVNGSGITEIEGRLIGLDERGALKLLSPRGQIITVLSGDLHTWRS